MPWERSKVDRGIDMEGTWANECDITDFILIVVLFQRILGFVGRHVQRMI